MQATANAAVIDRVYDETFNDFIESKYRGKLRLGDANETHQSVKSFSGHNDNLPEQTIKQVSKTSIIHLIKTGYCFSPDDKAKDIYEIMKNNLSITEFTVIENNIAVGFLTRTNFNEILGGQYGFSLFSKNPIREIMRTDFLSVDYCMSLDQVSKIAMQRPFNRLYNPIVVENAGNYLGIVTVKDLLDACTNMALAERDEIALMRDNLKIGIFFMDQNYIIQEQYSRYLEELLSLNSLAGKNFTDLLSTSVNTKELNCIKDYLDMAFNGTLDQEMLDDINPLMELYYNGGDIPNRKVLQCGFATIKHSNTEVYILVSVYDITARVELQQRLTDEENKRNDEMKTLFETLQVDPLVFDDFLEDTEYEFKQIYKTLKDERLTSHEKIVNIYQSIHAIKSNAVILGLNSFGNKAHNLESKIGKLREQNENSSSDMLNLKLDIDGFTEEKEKIKTTIIKINSFKSKYNRNYEQILIDALIKTTNKAADDMNKKVNFITGEIDGNAIRKGPRRIIKEVLIQFIRNSVVHGIEEPKERLENGKEETGVIKLSVKMKDENIHVKLKDDGRGLDYNKIAEKALKLKLIKPEDKNNKDILLKTIFSPCFSTAENETVHAGRGIGLSLVYDRVVREGKGSIKVKTESGKGTAFHVYFPA